jgi:hypothetical protein
MADWARPPEFGPNGEPPAVASSVSFFNEAFFVVNREHQDAADCATKLALLDVPPGDMRRAYDWLWASIGSNHSITQKAEPPEPPPPVFD